MVPSYNHYWLFVIWVWDHLCFSPLARGSACMPSWGQGHELGCTLESPPGTFQNPDATEHRGASL